MISRWPIVYGWLFEGHPTVGLSIRVAAYLGPRASHQLAMHLLALESLP